MHFICHDQRFFGQQVRCQCAVLLLNLYGETFRHLLNNIMYINGLQFQLKIIFVDLRSLQNFFNLLVHALIFRFNDAGIIVQHIGVFAYFLH
ncbi:hypothetical protein D3C87_1570450 [compost metagenome]